MRLISKISLTDICPYRYTLCLVSQFMADYFLVFLTYKNFFVLYVSNQADRFLQNWPFCIFVLFARLGLFPFVRWRLHDFDPGRHGFSGLAAF